MPVDVRVVVATQAPLEDEVRSGRFRSDLFARLNGLVVRLSPLRSRREEVPSLFAHLIAAQATAPVMDAGFVERLCCYRWPLNVRELGLLARKLLALHGREKVLKRSHVPELVDGPGLGAAEAVGPDQVRPAGLVLAPDELAERRQIVRVLEDCAGSQTEAARRLNLSRSALIDRLKRYAIPRPRARRNA